VGITGAEYTIFAAGGRTAATGWVTEHDTKKFNSIPIISVVFIVDRFLN
jgi:hypothetical protein